jgi:hypothetical protein
MNCLAQDFSIGLANVSNRFIPQKEKYAYADHDFISPGVELQLSYRFFDNWVIMSGANYQSFYFNTPIKNETYPPGIVYSLLGKDLSIPILLRYNFMKLSSSCHLGFTSGLYFAIPLYAEETINDKITGGGGYRARDIAYYTPPKYSFIYAGLGAFKVISPEFEIYAEPFCNYQLKKNLNQSVVTQEFRSQFWYGIKIGINYSFKIWKYEN